MGAGFGVHLHVVACMACCRGAGVCMARLLRPHVCILSCMGAYAGNHLRLFEGMCMVLGVCSNRVR